MGFPVADFAYCLSYILFSICRGFLCVTSVHRACCGSCVVLRVVLVCLLLGKGFYTSSYISGFPAQMFLFDTPL